MPSQCLRCPRCRGNGEEVQRGNTNTLICDCAALLAYISTFTTLRPGDVVLTGTPDDIGAARTPKCFLSDSDIVETHIEGLGTMRDTVRAIDTRRAVQR